MASFYVRKSGQSNWIVYIQDYNKSKRGQRALKPEEYNVFQIDRDWSVSEAKNRISTLNKQNRLEISQKSKAASNANLLKTEASIYVNKVMATKFLTHLLEDVCAGNIEKARRNKILMHWKTAQKIITTVKLHPKDYAKNSNKFFNYFAQKNFSVDYSLKLLRVINAYGDRSTANGQYFKPIKLNRVQYQEIRDSYINSDRYRGPADALTPEALKRKRSKLSEGNYNWLFVSVWFGLRPDEIDSLYDQRFGYKMAREKDTRALQIYQSKLKSVSEENRWKYIPIIFDEQRDALKLISSMELKRPLNKTLKKVFESNVRAYSGRKGFVDLMLENNRQIEEISAWLGHASIETTWKHYKSRSRITIMRAKGA